jgi:hypothetical protein
MAWMDTTRIAPEPDGYVGGWYKVEAAGETKYTVVHYAVDCPGFRLTIRRSVTYDGSGAVIGNQRPLGTFFSPPPILSLQTFMHTLCRRSPHRSG